LRKSYIFRSFSLSRDRASAEARVGSRESVRRSARIREKNRFKGTTVLFSFRSPVIVAERAGTVKSGGEKRGGEEGGRRAVCVRRVEEPAYTPEYRMREYGVFLLKKSGKTV
jgi:hypothetical protein